MHLSKSSTNTHLICKMLFLELKPFSYNKKFLVHYEHITLLPNAEWPHSFQKGPGIALIAREKQD